MRDMGLIHMKDGRILLGSSNEMLDSHNKQRIQSKDGERIAGVASLEILTYAEKKVNIIVQTLEIRQ